MFGFRRKSCLDVPKLFPPFNMEGITRDCPRKLGCKTPLPPSCLAIPARCDSLASPLYMLTVGPTPAGTSGLLPMSSAGLVGSNAALLLWTGTSLFSCLQQRTTFACHGLRFSTFVFDVDHPLRPMLCTVLRSFRPALPNDGLFPQLSNRHFQLLTSTAPPKACCVQYSVIFVTTISKVGHLQQPWFVHVLLFLTSTIPSRACCVQESEIFLLSIPKIGILPKPLALHFVLLEKLIVPSFTARPQHYRVVLNTRADRQCWRALIPLSVLSSNLGFVDVFFYIPYRR